MSIPAKPKMDSVERARTSIKDAIGIVAGLSPASDTVAGQSSPDGSRRNAESPSVSVAPAREPVRS